MLMINLKYGRIYPIYMGRGMACVCAASLLCVCLAHAIIIAQAVYNYSKQQQQLLKKLCKANVVGGQKGKERKKEKEQGRGPAEERAGEGEGRSSQVQWQILGICAI